MKDKYIIYFISRTKASMIKFIENQLQKHELYNLIPTHGNILTALYESEEKLTMKDIAKKIGKDKSTVTALINKMESLGYVEKEKSVDDKRITYINLTQKSYDIQDKYNSISSEVNKTAFSNFTSEEKEEFLRLLKKLGSNFRNANKQDL